MPGFFILQFYHSVNNLKNMVQYIIEFNNHKEKYKGNVMEKIYKIVAEELKIPVDKVENTIKLLDDGATIPFVARYRKEVTGNLDEVQIGDILQKVEYLRNLEERKEEVIRLIEEQGKLTEELRNSIIEAKILQEVEDIYFPYRKKKKTKADIAKERGLEPLAEKFYTANNLEEIQNLAKDFITEEVPTVEDAIEGAMLIIAQNISEKAEYSGKVKTLLEIIDVAKEAIFKIVDWILAYSPIGVFALTSVNFASYGSSLFGPYIKLTIGVVLGIVAMVLIVYPLMMAVTLKVNPFKVLMKIKEPMLTAFVTRSSAAALPVSLRVAKEDLKISENISSFALPLGSTINMDGVCIHLPMFAILAANMFGVKVTFVSLSVLVLTTVLASVGAGGVPGGSLMLLFIILQNMKLSPDQIAIIVGLALGINPILDMFETMNNVTGDIVCTYSVAKLSGLVDEDKE